MTDDEIKNGADDQKASMYVIVYIVGIIAILAITGLILVFYKSIG
jgi:flagellar basal body-associated protein FliL